MNAIAQWLKEKGKIVIPKTLDTQVFDENGKSLDRRLKTAKDEEVIQLPKVNPTMIFSDLDYSTEEQMTGRRWIDGRPIYQKTLFIADSISNTEMQTSSTIENVDTVIKLNGFCKWNDGNSYAFPIPYITRSLDQSIQIFYEYSTKSIYIGTNITITNVYATMIYTKTTDTASSPVATPKVEAMHNYSTEEKVVGTWIDGKPLYEKTIVYDGIVKTDTKIYQNESIDEIVNVSNKCFYDTLFNKWNTEITSTYNLGIIARGDYLQGEVNSEYGDRITKCRCTIQYTKTTDTATI